MCASRWRWVILPVGGWRSEVGRCRGRREESLVAAAEAEVRDVTVTSQCLKEEEEQKHKRCYTVQFILHNQVRNQCFSFREKVASQALKYSAASDLYFLFTASAIFRPMNPQLQTHAWSRIKRCCRWNWDYSNVSSHVSTRQQRLCSLSSGLCGRFVSCSMSYKLILGVKSSCLHENLAPTTAETLRTCC